MQVVQFTTSTTTVAIRPQYSIRNSPGNSFHERGLHRNAWHLVELPAGRPGSHMIEKF